jgi:hypothetical protein
MEPVLINISKRLFDTRIERLKVKFFRSVAACTLYDCKINEEERESCMYAQLK